uniref:Rab3 GTPase-activating protein catalytic subunit n=1 Tax=Timema californicum TaxID=61474 RepID=A0A7R9P7H3_TIMCA|nr:unnamed protein product [Timema californicum]
MAMRVLEVVLISCVTARRNYEKKLLLLNGVAPGFPNHRTCLLHQKLQMLNCCISRKITRQRLSKAGSVDIDELDSDSEDEEFFDCNNSEEPGGESREEKRRQKHSLWNQPVGRLEKHGNMRLLKTGEHLYIPITQDPTPKTEDQIEEDANVLLELGTDTEAAELRARMMSASLLSDMESFKAANPGACLEDFIRWYSPRDWIEEGGDEFGQKKGTLSARMMIKDNMWVEVWNAAKPVPSRRQKRLFDDTREAEKVMHFLDSRKLSGVAELLLPTLIHAAICRLLEEQKDDLPGLANALQHIIKKAQRVTRNPHPTQSHYEDLVAELVGIEAVIAQANSLEHKFHSSETATPNFHTFLSQMMSAPEVEVPGGPRGLIGSRIRAMFAEAQKATQMRTDLDPVSLVEEPWSHNPSAQFPQPSQREFVMRVIASRPAPSSTPTPQKVYALLRREEFRLAGCFSHDTIFQ